MSAMQKSEMERYEVIIVGACVSGAMLASLLDHSGLRVLLLEKT
jgi:flavin-dependent dehydrogenase